MASPSHNDSGDGDGPLWVFVAIVAVALYFVIGAIVSAINSGPGLSPGGW